MYIHILRSYVNIHTYIQNKKKIKNLLTIKKINVKISYNKKRERKKNEKV